MIDIMAQVAVPLDDGSWVNARIARIVEIIRDMNVGLDVRWIPRDKREEGDAAFAIVEKTPTGREVVAFLVQNESDFDERVLERIFLSDTTKHDILREMDAKNAAAKLLQLKEQMDAAEEAKELAVSVLRSPKHVYKHNGRRYGQHESTWRDHRPIIIP